LDTGSSSICQGKTISLFLLVVSQNYWIVMRQRLLLGLSLIFLFGWTAAACASEIFNFHQTAQGDAPRTPFLSKATYTGTTTPLAGTTANPAGSTSQSAADAPDQIEDGATSDLVSPTTSSILPSTSVPAPSSIPTQVQTSCTYTGNSIYEYQVVVLINQKREDRGLSPLVMDSRLNQSARRHSADMTCNDFLSHTGSDGSTLSSRLLDAGYSYSWAAENIAAGSSSDFSAQAVVSLWMQSSGHKKNLLNPNMIHIGVGFRYVVDNDTGDHDAYYTADFGAP
jgi:uncharacterized protein YkwD